jgi:acyl-CoA reductase-like NAD-dependent aldehyde dehydrogenase
LGIIGINEGIISTGMALFGPVKESRLGRERSRHGIGAFFGNEILFMGGLDG